MITLYSYWRSSASYRVRIALNLKGLDYETVPINLVRGEHNGDYRKRNPQGLVPALEHDGLMLIQSLAIIDFLDQLYPEPPLLPEDAAGRARVNALAQIVVAEMHPLNNIGVLNYLTRELGVSAEQKQAWYERWIARGFDALEALLANKHTGAFCHGNRPSLADACLVPQVYNARRFKCDLEPYPVICRIEAACMERDAFRDAAPERQPDSDE